MMSDELERGQLHPETFAGRSVPADTLTSLE